MKCTSQTSAPFEARWSPAKVVRPPRRSERRRPAGSGATALRLLKLAEAARLWLSLGRQLKSVWPARSDSFAWRA